MSIEVARSIGARPADWPAPGPIDLMVHDPPHDSASMEWWYVNAHVTAADGRPLSLFAAFFRVDVTGADDVEKTYSHFLTWALVDPRRQRYFPRTLLDPRSPTMALDDLDHGRGPRDERLARALREIIAAGCVPLPDRLLEREAVVALDRLCLSYDRDRFAKAPNGSYELDLRDEDGRTGCRLQFTLQKPIVRHGDDGVVRGLADDEMFYYFSPSCQVEGAVLVDGAWIGARGSGWYDHEFGEQREKGNGYASSAVGWNWAALQLDNGYDVTAYDLFDKAEPSTSHGRWVIVVDPSGGRHAHDDFTLRALDTWTSTKTFNEYPTRYRLDIDRAGLHVELTAAMPGQEVMTIISPPAFWEGLVTVSGTMNGTPVAGRGFVERRGVNVVETTDDFFASVGRETRRAIDALLPERLGREQALTLIGGPRRLHFLDGVDLEQYSRTVLRPIREIILRGGKAWRSYGILSCMDLVGGDSQPFAHWLALPELLHVGSLIIDDVQDGSDVRRGGPACHTIYGQALAINAGCASYFLAQLPIGSSSLDDTMRVRIYETYFEAVRAAHAGQAFDIDSLGRLMPGVVETGDSVQLERRVLAIHRLKSAAPAGALARMAVLIGGGTDEQSEGLGALYESFGVAFQIIDDVLNLRGFDDHRKSHGEDITAGKVTAPVATAMGRLARGERRQLWSILSSQSTEPALIDEAIALIDGSGALEACEQRARDLVETAWTRVDPLIPHTQFKIRLRAFGWFVLDRHY
jgi:geranylgeranyl pyrophosphate synthase/predicted secreted hydrolase